MPTRERSIPRSPCRATTPTCPRSALTYNSLTANPLPIIVVEPPARPDAGGPDQGQRQVDLQQAPPARPGITTRANSRRATSSRSRSRRQRLQAGTGRYGYSVQVVDERSTNTTTTYSGTATVLNQSTSAFGDGWTLEGLEQITPARTSGVILSLGDNGESLWFSGSPSVGGIYTSPAGDFSTLTKTSTGYTARCPTAPRSPSIPAATRRPRSISTACIPPIATAAAS